MKRISFFIICLSMLLVACSETETVETPVTVANQAAITVIQNARIIDAVSNSATENAILIIENGHIQNIGTAGNITVPEGATVINMAGKTLMPGMINMHGHVGRRYEMAYGPEYYSFDTTHRDANSYLYFGVTHSTSLGQDWPPMMEFINAQRAGQVGGAHLYTGEYGFTVTGGFQGNNPFAHKPNTPEEARVMVQQIVANNPVSLIKMWVDDQGGRVPKINPEVYGAIIDEAHKFGLSTFVHLSQVEDARELISRGIDVLAHIPRDIDIDAEFIQLAVDNGVVQTSNLVSLQGNRIYLQPDFLDNPGLRLMFPDVIDIINTPEAITQRLAGRTGVPPDPNVPPAGYVQATSNLSRLHQAGVPIVIGTDSGMAGQFQGIWEHRDMMLLVRDAGLTEMEAIQAATINGARALGIDSDYGSLETGKMADFIVLNSNPLDDINNSLDIDAVWMNGEEVDRTLLPITVAPPVDVAVVN